MKLFNIKDRTCTTDAPEDNFGRNFLETSGKLTELYLASIPHT